MAGKLIVFEGIDGSGKSTQVNLLQSQLVKGVKVRSLSNSVLGQEIETQVKSIKRSPLVEALLFAAARLHTYIEYGAPLLETGYTLVYDRYVMDAYAYSTYTYKTIEDFIHNINKAMPYADLTFLLDLDPELALSRLEGLKDHYEELSILKKIRERYLAIASSSKPYFKDQNWVILDGSKPINVIQSLVWEEVQKIL